MIEPQLVSIVVPCRNEREHLPAFMASALAQALPAGWRLELVVADGESDDGTRAELARLQAADARVRVVDNIGRIVSSGLNRAIAAAAGQVIVRMDVHTTYACDYVAECLAALQASGADNVGGPWRAETGPDASAVQAAAAAAFQSPWVTGGAFSRRIDYDGWVDTVYLGAWPRATFERFGGFDEALVRNQDDEHNLRIAGGGGRVWQSSRVHSAYRPRSTLRQTFRQYLQYGYWKPFVMRKHRKPASWRQLVPAAFVLSLVAAVPVGAAIGSAAPLAWLVAAYALAVAAMTLGIAAGGARLPGRALAIVPLVIAIYHVAYGLGSLAGWIDVLRGHAAAGRYSALTR